MTERKEERERFETYCRVYDLKTLAAMLIEAERVIERHKTENAKLRRRLAEAQRGVR